MTGEKPRRPLPKEVRNGLFRWGGLFVLMVLVWSFDRFTKGDSIAQVVEDVPWGWVVFLVAAVVGGYQLLTRPLEPEVEEAVRIAMEQRAQIEHTCRYCGQARQPQAIKCTACGKVVNWSGLLTVTFLALATLLLVAQRLVR